VKELLFTFMHIFINHRITEWQSLEGTSGDHVVQTPAKAGSYRPGCTGPHPDGF